MDNGFRRPEICHTVIVTVIPAIRPHLTIPRTRRHDARGLSMSVFVCIAIFALLLATGLAVDGAAQAHARRTCQTAAAEIARIGTDASASARIEGGNTVAAGTQAAQAAAQKLYPNLTVQVSVADNARLVVRASTSVPTLFLTLMGIGHLAASGEASATLS